ncbi:hypothetical protein C8J56DRAFT_1086208 [Mycena floridula]|nr:hypothetical protein C8J56DRAFT_1086208 [Mycena floridula]
MHFRQHFKKPMPTGTRIILIRWFSAGRRWMKRFDVSSIKKVRNSVHLTWDPFHQVLKNTNSRKIYKPSSRRICANSLCPSEYTTVNLTKVCGGCLSVHYCSKQCRKVHWTNGHRDECFYSLQSSSDLTEDFVSWLILVRVSTSIDNQAFVQKVETARGSYPVVVTFSMITELTIHSGESFLRQRTTLACDEVVKNMVRIRESENCSTARFQTPMEPISLLSLEGGYLPFYRISRGQSRLFDVPYNHIIRPRIELGNIQRLW